MNVFAWFGPSAHMVSLLNRYGSLRLCALVALGRCRPALGFSPVCSQQRALTLSSTRQRSVVLRTGPYNSAADDDTFQAIASATVMAATVAAAAQSPAGQRVLDAEACKARSGGAARHAEASSQETMPLAILLMVLDSVAFPSASKARKAVRTQLVRLNGCPTGSTDRAGVGDVITWGERVLPGFNPIGRASFSIPVLFEDDDWAVVHKPAGPPMYAAPESGHSKPAFSILSALSYALRAPRVAGGVEPLPRPLPVHRLDRRTEGLLCVAKSRRAISALSAAFAARAVRKEYRCIVVGMPAGSNLGGTGTIEAPLDGQTASTTWRVLDTVTHAAGERPPLSLLAVWPHTGRTHQVRRHCAEALGCPIVGEDFPWRNDLNAPTGASPVRALFSRKFYLCAVGLVLQDPITGATREFALPDPPKFGQLLRRHGAARL